MATDEKTNVSLPREKKLSTEGPMSEKDEQGKATERNRKKQAEALKNWRATHPEEKQIIIKNWQTNSVCKPGEEIILIDGLFFVMQPK